MEEHDRTFWMDLGNKIEKCSGDIKQMGEKFDRFYENEFKHLEKTVERLTWLVAVGCGILMAVEVLLRFVK